MQNQIRLIGYSGDPEFENMKQSANIIMQEQNIIINTREYDNEVDYDTEFKKAKRSNQAFLQTYHVYKS